MKKVNAVKDIVHRFKRAFDLINRQHSKIMEELKYHQNLLSNSNENEGNLY